MRIDLVLNKSLPVECLERLATDLNPRVRKEVAQRAKELGDPYLFALATVEQ